MADDEIFFVPDDISFLTKKWEGESVVYNEASGETNLLDERTEGILREISSAPQTKLQLAKYLRDHLSEKILKEDHEVSREIDDYLGLVLSQLETLGLIDRRRREDRR
ncbi:MAG: HPr-rel-A system PqqD family peptide chaperone [bacterium]